MNMKVSVIIPVYNVEKYLFRCVKSVIDQTYENIEIILNAVPSEIIGDNRVNAMKIIREGKEEKIFTDGIFVAVGTVPNSGLLKGFVKLDKNGYIIADEDGVTSVSGFFAAGDVRTKSVRQVITAAADGASCVYSAENYILKNNI